MADENLKVSKEKLGAWGFDMATYSVDATSDAFADVRLMEGAALHASMGANQSGGVFAEGAVMHAGIERQAAAFNAFLKAYDKCLLIRTTGDIIALSPPLIVEKSHIDQIFSMLADILKNLD